MAREGRLNQHQDYDPLYGGARGRVLLWEPPHAPTLFTRIVMSGVRDKNVCERREYLTWDNYCRRTAGLGNFLCIEGCRFSKVMFPLLSSSIINSTK